MIIQTNNHVTLVGGGEVTPAQLTESLTLAPVLVAADGGAGAALKAGAMPQAVIGDFDSLQPEIRDLIPPDRLHHVAEQESTDFDKALRSISAPLILGHGFLGQRVDHELAALNTLITKPGPPCILVGRRDVIFAAPPRVALDLPPHTRFSLFPLAAVTGRSTGLHWPIDGISFIPGGPIGTSNRTTGAVMLDFDQPGMLVILPQDQLPAAIAAHVPAK
ncbi:thiamine diphosphokinase [Actibacterium sp. 188UL27-1]|uniref:thiamine diphosphokinase n=1 Tax=Actibacterium sp. 188UL27-1 TaxID=2786961 RepID=UPI001EF5BA85|nr:thiamine diphosphokinase [Actibacterium sp. 188UL27-1]